MTKQRFIQIISFLSYTLILGLLFVVINQVFQPDPNDVLPPHAVIPTRDIFWNTPMPNPNPNRIGQYIALAPSVAPTTAPNSAQGDSFATPFTFNSPIENPIERSRIQLTLVAPDATSSSTDGLNLTPEGAENTETNSDSETDADSSTADLDLNPDTDPNNTSRQSNSPTNNNSSNDGSVPRNNNPRDNRPGNPGPTPFIQPTNTPVPSPTRPRVQLNLTPDISIPTYTPFPSPTPYPTLRPTNTPTLTPTVPPDLTELWVDVSSISSQQIGTQEHPYKSLASAVSAARNGMIIHVRPGIYIGELDLGAKSLTIQSTSNNPNDVVIAGLGRGIPLVRIAGGASNLTRITLRGLRGLNTGIFIESGALLRFTAIHLDNLEYGIRMTGAADVHLRDSLASYNHHAVRIESTTGSLNAVNNLILNSSRGIYSNTNALIQNNTIAVTHIGLEVNHANTIVRFNILWDNTQDIASSNLNQLTLDSNILETGAGGQATTDPLFAMGTKGQYYLSPSSPAIDAAWMSSQEALLNTRTTRTDGVADTGKVDLGYHYDNNLGFTHIARQIYVDASNTNFQDGSIVRPWRKIVDAINTTRLGRSGDVILIQNGTYQENLTITKRDLILRGLGTNVILNGNNRASVIQLDTSETVIEGLTLRAGAAQNGGAISIITSDDVTVRRAIVRNTIIENSSATTSGGAIYVSRSAPLIERNLIRNNQAPNGSGIELINAQNAVIRNNIFENNSGAYAIRISSQAESSIVVYNTIVKNGGGIQNVSGTNRYAYNILWDNVAGNIMDTNATGVFQDNLVNAETASLDISATTSPFVDLAGGDYQLLPDSAAIDAGVALPNILIDLEGKPRSLDGNGDGIALPDLGALELDTNSIIVTPDDGKLYVNGAVATTGTGTIASPFKTIAEAISAATVGQTIVIYPATYSENLLIDKAVHLTGVDASRAPTIIEGGENPALTITGNAVIIEGLTIQNSSVAVLAENVTGLVLNRNHISTNQTALRLKGEILVVNNLIHANQAGIHAEGAVTIALNTIIANTSTTCSGFCTGGIYAASAEVTISGNILSGNKDDFASAEGIQATLYANLIGDGDKKGENLNFQLAPLLLADYVPSAGSPVIDALPLDWSPDYMTWLAVDYYGRSRPMDGNSDQVLKLDIGAIEAFTNTQLLIVDATPTAEPSITPIATLTELTPIVEVTAEISPTASATLEATEESSPTATETATTTPTETATSTPSPSETPSPTATETPSLTPTPQEQFAPPALPTQG